MSDEGRERGRRLLAALSQQVKKAAPPSGVEANARGLKALAELAEDLTGPNAPPGLQLWRDSAEKFRLTRTQRPGELVVLWDRPAQALHVTADKLGQRIADVRFVFHEALGSWRRFDIDAELYEEVTALLVEVLYPEARPK